MLGRLRHSNSVGVWLVIAFTSLRALVPAGFMLHATAGSSLTVVICHDFMYQVSISRTLADAPSAHHSMASAENGNAQSDEQKSVANKTRCADCIRHSPILANSTAVQLGHSTITEIQRYVITALVFVARQELFEARAPPTLS